MKYLFCILLLAVSGCATTTKPAPIVVKDHYIVRAIPDEYFVIPAQVSPIDLNTATQKTVAVWLLRSEERTRDLETKLRTAKQIQDENIKNSDVEPTNK